jgi:alanyl-tRNA synthetase
MLAIEFFEKMDGLGAELLAKHGSREAVSIACGYFPAWQAAELYDTYGLHPADMLQRLKKAGLKFDWGGFEYEMAKRGGDVSGLVREGKEFERSINHADL